MITLLFKKGDILDTANWRSITLLCTDYKILAKTLSFHLLRVIAAVVSSDQSCSIPGRFIVENVRLLHDVVEYSSLMGVPAAVLSLDQEKPLIGWSGLSCQRYSSVWDLGPLFLIGSIYFMPGCHPPWW